jgi:hypothetical protein
LIFLHDTIKYSFGDVATMISASSLANRRRFGLLYRIERNLQFIPKTSYRHFVAAFKTGFMQPFAAKPDLGHDCVPVRAWEVFAVNFQLPFGGFVRFFFVCHSL